MDFDARFVDQEVRLAGRQISELGRRHPRQPRKEPVEAFGALETEPLGHRDDLLGVDDGVPILCRIRASGLLFLLEKDTRFHLHRM
jgi:hypothetical protein